VNFILSEVDELEKKIEIIVKDNDITINNYHIGTGEMVKVLYGIIAAHTKGDYKENYFDLGK
jgi:Asp-tRNA(Asn)/Glu-tRNA(Gln) amidotransferase B subunit